MCATGKLMHPLGIPIEIPCTDPSEYGDCAGRQPDRAVLSATVQSQQLSPQIFTAYPDRFCRCQPPHRFAVPACITQQGQGA